jgi:hypothetical protein
MAWPFVNFFSPTNLVANNKFNSNFTYLKKIHIILKSFIIDSISFKILENETIVVIIPIKWEKNRLVYLILVLQPVLLKNLIYGTLRKKNCFFFT